MITRRGFIRSTASLSLAFAAGTGLYAWRFEPHWVETVHRNLQIDHLPDSLAGKKLIQLSDLHIGNSVDDHYLIRSFQYIASLQPDILVITGDFITYRGGDQLDQVASVLQHAPHGRLATLAILGNHDYGPRWDNTRFADQLAFVVRQHGIDLLRNQKRTVSGLQIAGIDDAWTPNFAPQLVMPTIDQSKAYLTLCHNPDVADMPVWPHYSGTGWILSGHTHGGQCRIPCYGPPRVPVSNKRFVSGEYFFTHPDFRRLYVNRGLGHHWPLRFLARPEITVFTLA